MDNDTNFIDAIEAGDQAQVEALLDAQPELLEVRVEDWMSPVLLALYYNQPEIAQMLWKRGAVLDIFGAAAIGDVTRLEELLQVYPELALAYAPDGYQPLGLAAFFGQHQAAAALISHGAPVNSPSHNDM